MSTSPTLLLEGEAVGEAEAVPAQHLNTSKKLHKTVMKTIGDWQAQCVSGHALFYYIRQ